MSTIEKHVHIPCPACELEANDANFEDIMEHQRWDSLLKPVAYWRTEAVRKRVECETFRSLVERAYDRFTNNDMVPPNKFLKDWLFEAEQAFGLRSMWSDAPIAKATREE